MAVQSCEVQWGCTRVKPSQVCVSDESTKQRSPHCHCWLHSAMVNDLQHLGHLSLPPEAAAFVLHVPSCLVQRSLPICICHSGVARTLKQLFQHHQHHQQHLHGFTAKYFILNLRQDPSPDRDHSEPPETASLLQQSIVHAFSSSSTTASLLRDTGE